MNNLQNIMTIHGNPTIGLTLPGAAATRRAVVCPHPHNEPIWISHNLSPIDDAVRIDAWHGEFVHALAGASILPQGEYCVSVESTDRHRHPIATIHVDERVLFDGTLTGPKTSWFPPTVQAHPDGPWTHTPAGLCASDPPAYLFADGEMHGTLEAAFDLKNPPPAGNSWGLIARHYSAFHHLRVLFTCCDDRIVVRLIRKSTTASRPNDFSVIAEASLPAASEASYRVVWRLNGRRHSIGINDLTLLEAQDGYMGGVTVVGLFSETSAVAWSRWAMRTSQPVPTGEVTYPHYHAAIRPGNIHRLCLTDSDAPQQNLCWESGIQFGHIGGSEIKFSQNARLIQTCRGHALTQYRWEGAMPKFVDQANDVRGRARGVAGFFADRIVLADYVLTHVRRSVGPDVDLLSRVMNGPARIALAGCPTFQPWSLPTDGETVSLGSLCGHDAYPAAVLFPVLLGRQSWWLKAIIANLLHIDGRQPASLFAWRCPHGLTASHDFRASPTEPGVEYGFSIVLCWQQSDDIDAVENDLLNLREDWMHPMDITPTRGSTLTYVGAKEHPAEAIGFDGCFDRAQGVYRVTAEQGTLAFELKPGTIPRRSATFLIDALPSDATLHCLMEDRPLTPGTEYIDQPLSHDTRLLCLYEKIDAPVRMRIEAQTH